MKRATALLAAAVVAAACAAQEKAPMTATHPPASLAGTKWVGVLEPGADPKDAPRLEFIGGRINGFTGCNLMSGAWRVEGGEIRFGAIAATRRACIGPAGEIEKRVLAAMGDASRVQRRGDRLVVEAPGGARFEFVEVK
jgi:heat shock protein HslJ